MRAIDVIKSVLAGSGDSVKLLRQLALVLLLGLATAILNNPAAILQPLVARAVPEPSLQLPQWVTEELVGAARAAPLAQDVAHGQQYGITMPTLGLSQEDVSDVLAYIQTQSGGAQATPAPPAGQPALPAGNADLGHDLFTGQVAFSNGGLACISCHNVSGVGILGGGSVGRDLTQAYANFGPMGITSILRAIPFPIMKEAFAGHPLTDVETVNLVAFLQEASGRSEETQGPIIFIVLGVAGLLIIIGLFQLFWRNRLSGVRQPLVATSRCGAGAGPPPSI